MSIDYEFIGLMFKKYSNHLQDVVTSIETNLDTYDKQLKELENNPQKWSKQIRELENKKTEAFKKLNQICPNMDKMAEQLQEIQQEIFNK